MTHDQEQQLRELVKRMNDEKNGPCRPECSSGCFLHCCRSVLAAILDQPEPQDTELRERVIVLIGTTISEYCAAAWDKRSALLEKHADVLIGVVQQEIARAQSGELQSRLHHLVEEAGVILAEEEI